MKNLANFEKEAEKVLKSCKFGQGNPSPPLLTWSYSDAWKLLESSTRFSYFFCHLHEELFMFTRFGYFLCLKHRFPASDIQYNIPDSIIIQLPKAQTNYLIFYRWIELMDRISLYIMLSFLITQPGFRRSSN